MNEELKKCVSFDDGSGIPYCRMAELASLAIDGLIEDDENEALIYLRDTMDLTQEECKYFGIDYEKMNEAY